MPTMERTSPQQEKKRLLLVGNSPIIFHLFKHYHKIATEIMVITSGSVHMNGGVYHTGGIIIMEPGESTDFETLGDHTTNVVVKYPGVDNDKYAA